MPETGYDAMEEEEDCYVFYSSHGRQMIIPKEEGSEKQ